jgi:AcrR family transcriptional regulator
MNNSRQHILDIALTLFSNKNFKEVTLNDIVMSSGLSKGAFYHFFKSKEAVFKEVVDFLFVQWMNPDYTLFATSSFNDFISSYLKWIKNKVSKADSEAKKLNINFYLIVFEASKFIPDFEEKLVQMQRDELKAWQKVIANAQKSGEIKKTLSAETIAKLFLEIGNGIGIRLTTSKQQSQIQKELSMAWQSVYKLIAA